MPRCWPCRCARAASQAAAGCRSPPPGQCQPAIPAAPDPAQVGRPALIGCACHRRQRLDPRTLAHGPFADLPALELEDALHGVLVHAQQPGYGAVAERRLLLDQLLDRLGQLRPHLRRGLGGPVIHRPPRHAELAGQPRYAQLAHPERFGKEPLNANAGVKASGAVRGRWCRSRTPNADGLPHHFFPPIRLPPGSAARGSATPLFGSTSVSTASSRCLQTSAVTAAGPLETLATSNPWGVRLRQKT